MATFEHSLKHLRDSLTRTLESEFLLHPSVQYKIELTVTAETSGGPLTLMREVLRNETLDDRDSAAADAIRERLESDPVPEQDPQKTRICQGCGDTISAYAIACTCGERRFRRV